MKIMLPKLRVYLFILVIVSSCSKVRDEQPEPLDQIPDAVAKVLKDAYPNAREITLKTLEQNKEWEARFSQGELQYYVTLNPSKILAAHKLISPTVPDSIKRYFETIPVLSPNKGVLSDFRQIIDTTGSDRNYTAKFTVDQRDYLLTFRTYNQPSNDYDVTVTNYYKFSYYDLNSEISRYLINNKYADAFAKIMVLGDNKKRYTVWTNHVHGERGDMVFDDTTQLIVSFRRVEALSRLTDFPESIQHFVKNTGLTLSDENYKFAENNISGYHILLVGIAGLNGYRYSLEFDQDGKVITFQLNIAIVHNRK